MVCKTRRCKDKPPRYEYTCNGYHRYGKENCTPHTIGEEVIDKLIYEELNEVKKMALESFKKVDKQLKKWLANKPSAEKQIAALNEKLAQLRLDQQQILLERIRDREHAEVYTQMLVACESDIAKLGEKINEFRNIDETVKKRKKD